VRLRIKALFLLVLLLRVLLPDSAILALHRHTHTTDKRLDTHVGKEQLDVQHIHCETDQLFHNSFYALPTAVALPLIVRHLTAYQGLALAIWKFTFPNNTLLRGPPVMLA
jgi:hypothetical protein